MVYACHCTDCQKRSGAAFGLSVWVPRASISLASGKVALQVSRNDAGREHRVRVCATCMTRLWSEPMKRPEVGILRGGTLDDVSWLKPAAHIWTRSAQPWFVFPEGAKRYEMQPPSMDDIAALWRKQLDG